MYKKIGILNLIFDEYAVFAFLLQMNTDSL